MKPTDKRATTDEAAAGGSRPPGETAGPADDAESEAAPTAEEQMARFEEALKESDWGHQPC